jgi:chemotaxis protein MotA
VDPTGILALVTGVGLILFGNYIEGGHIDSLIQPTAALIVLGGTVGATWLSATPAEVKLLFKLTPRVVRPGLADRKKTTEDLLRIANVVRRDGMLAAEGQLASIPDPMLRRGLQMLVDGTTIDEVRSVLETEIDLSEHHGTSAAKLWESAGGYSPTIGILGAVLGLIHVMQNLSDPTKLGAGIAVAFVATIYGVGFANLLFLPLGARIKKILHIEAEDRTMILAGLGGIAAGVNGRQLTEILAPYAGHHDEPSAEQKKAA